MTPELKKEFTRFLFSETPLYHNDDIEAIIKWVEENVEKKKVKKPLPSPPIQQEKI